MSRPHFIYGIVCDGILVYVGRSLNPVSRVRAHVLGATSAVQTAIRSAGEVTVSTLDACRADDVDDTEAAWIKHAIDCGHPLVNARGRDGRVAWPRAAPDPSAPRPRVQTEETFMLRVPSDVRAQLEELAARERRSMGNQVAFLISQEEERMKETTQ